MKKVGFLAVSLVVLLASGVANAEIAATSYVDGIVATKQDKLKIDTSNTYDSKNSDNDARIPTVQVAEDIAMATADAVVAATKVQLTEEFATKSSVAEVETAYQTADTALSGRVKTIEDSAVMASGATKAKIDSIATNTSDIATIKTQQTSQDSKITALETGKQDSLGYTAENSANKTTTISAAATASDVKYPSEKAVATALAGKAPAGDYATTTALNAVKATADSAVQADDLATVATTGSYNDLMNKPTIPAAQVQSDWNATEGMGVIKNKPSLATVATSGSYNDLANKPTIPSGALASKSTISNADVAANAAIAPTKIAIETSDTYKSVPAAELNQRIPSIQVAEDIAMATADAAVAAAVANVGNTYQVKSTAVTHTANTAAGDSTHPVYVAANGVATKIDKVAAATTADSATTATTATNAKKICNGSACSSYVDIWVE